ncbi:MAG: tetratricopeptide repeat protein [Thermoplasmata archaeon]|nr:tetratricopeptide repeat protein [Thermoplasmata archaeon]
MAASRIPSVKETRPVAPAEEARRLFRQASDLEPRPDRARYLEALKGYLAYVEKHRSALQGAAAEVASRLDESSMAFYRSSQPELAAKAVEAGLKFAPGSSTLLHHRALILLALNRNVDEVLSLIDRALEANPKDKTIWATKGDALRHVGRPEDAVEAYLRAQELEATSLQYVDRALKVAPAHPKALRVELDLARAHGAYRPALDACVALLREAPEDDALLQARAELLDRLGDAPGALAAADGALAHQPQHEGMRQLRVRLLLSSDDVEKARAAVQELLAKPEGLDGPALQSLAALVEARTHDRELALAIRERLRKADPRNLANLSTLRSLGVDLQRPDVAIDACQATLEVSPDNLDAMRALAELLLAAGRPDEGFEAYRRLVAAHPKEVEEIRKALAAARAAGRGELVESFAASIASESPEDVSAREETARLREARGDHEGALSAYEELLALRPGSVPFLLEKRRLLEELGRVDELPPVYDALFQADPTRGDVALERGHLYLKRAFTAADSTPERESAGRAALVSYERASTDPQFATESLLGLARASALVGELDRAVGAYRQFLEVPGHADSGPAFAELGHALRGMNRLTEAEACYDRALQLGLEEPELLWGEVEVLSVLNQEAKALRFVDLLLQRDPKNPLFLRRKGQLLLKSGRHAEGVAVLKSAVQGAEGSAHLQFEVAEALRSQGAYPDAIDYFRQGLVSEPKNRAGRLALADTLNQAGRFNEVIPVVDALLKEDPNDLPVWKTRADAYRALGRSSEVVYSLKAILLLDPQNGPALLERFRLNLAAGEKGEALDGLQQLLLTGGAEAQDAGLWLQLGDLATDMGRGEDANRSYEKAAQLDPSRVAEIATRRARLRLAAGRPDLALELLDQPASQPSGSERPIPSLLLRAEILMALERPSEAQAVYEQVRSRDPKVPEAVAGVARCLLDQGRHAEARDFLRGAMPQAPPQPAMYLLMAEAESGLGSLPEAIQAIQKGVETLPKSVELWVRLGELAIAKERWPDAAGAFAHAIALDSTRPELHLRAGFVAEKLGHPNEALALYDHATQVAPSNKFAWSSRGVALLSTGKPEEARLSFERALSLDADFDAAKEGKKTALQRTREGQVDRLGREALLLEAKLHRSVTKNDLFVTLHVPYDLLEPVLAAISRNPRVDLDHLKEEELRDLENASYQLITTALERRPEGIERRGFTLADVAVLSPPTATLDQVQRLFGYLRSVLEADLRPENLHLTPDVEELARHALQLPEAQRTLFQLVRTLRVGLFKARLIKTVESGGTAVHAPLPSLDLGAYSPEFQGAGASPTSPAGEEFFAPENVPAAPVGPLNAPPGTGPHGAGHGSGSHSHPSRSAATPRCVGCGGIASVYHQCGATMCHHCIAEFHTCPKCQQAVTSINSRPIGEGAVPAAAHPAGGAHPTSGLRSVVSRLRPSSRAASHAPPGPEEATTAHSKGGTAPHRPEASPSASKTPPGKAPEVPSEPDPAAAPPRPSHPREKRDDEPRL